MTLIDGVCAPQLYRFNFETQGAPTVNTIKRAVERLRQNFGGYEYAETPTRTATKLKTFSR